MKLLVLPGDGIGPEISHATVDVLKAADREFGLDIDVEEAMIGEAALSAHGTTLPGSVVESAWRADGIVLGPVSHYTYPPVDQGGINPSAYFRVHFDLVSNVRPCRSRKDLSIVRNPMDLIIVRENTEGFYSDRNMFMGSGEFMPDSDTAMSFRKITRAKCEIVAHTAFKLALDRQRKVTAVHKANVLKVTDGLFLNAIRHIAESYPTVMLDEVIVDAAAALLVREPEEFDVIVTTNMFGDILSDEASELAGGLGLAPSLNVGDSMCVAQAQHGSAPSIAGRGIANPTSLILSAAMLLDWLGERKSHAGLRAASRSIERAVETALQDPQARTPDVRGFGNTATFVSSVMTNVSRHAQR